MCENESLVIGTRILHKPLLDAEKLPFEVLRLVLFLVSKYFNLFLSPLKPALCLVKPSGKPDEK
jgi:hypothetical protein